jgi:hypothetical protein
MENAIQEQAGHFFQRNSIFISFLGFAVFVCWSRFLFIHVGQSRPDQRYSFNAMTDHLPALCDSHAIQLGTVVMRRTSRHGDDIKNYKENLY